MKEAQICINVPEKLEKRMERFKWVDWPSIALSTFSQKVNDLEKLENERKISEISEIAPEDKREVRESVSKEVNAICRKTSEDVASGKIKALCIEEFNKKYA